MNNFLTLKIHNLVLISFLCLVFAYNFHAIWLMYDFGSILLIAYFIRKPKKKMTRVQRYWLLFVLSYFSCWILFKHNFYGVLSIWDTFKHIPYIMAVTYLLQELPFQKVERIFKKLYKVILVVFMIQVVAVCVQFLTGTFFDDIGGTFGNGASHAIGYISLLAIVSSMVYSRRWWVPIMILLVSLALNILAENAGFFVLLCLLLFAVVLANGVNMKFILALLLGGIIAYMLLNSTLYTSKTFFDVVSGRLFGLFDVPTSVDIEDVRGRSSFLFLAYLMGGWFGVGAGYFSSIYMMDGGGVTTLNHIQINITEASHLLAEVGLVGLFLVCVTFILFISTLVKNRTMKLYLSFFFVATVFYSAVLMNESHFLLLLFVFCFLAILESRKESVKQRKLMFNGNNFELGGSIK